MHLTHRFPEECKRDLIPAIQANFRAMDDRKARAFGGFSMGGETTWSVMAQGLNEVWCLLPLSGDYWAVGLKDGKDFPVETADALIASIAASGVKPADGNLCYCLKPDGWHTYDDCYEYIWLMMPYLFSC